jgi:hypothetical protein
MLYSGDSGGVGCCGLSSREEIDTNWGALGEAGLRKSFVPPAER